MSKTASFQSFFMILALMAFLLRTNDKSIAQVDPLGYLAGLSIGLSLGVWLGAKLARPSQP